MTFHVGQKVVCVKTWHPTSGYGRGDEVGPVEGQFYTIRAIGYFNPYYPDITQFHLHEIKNPFRPYQGGFGEAAFGAYRFRPIVSRKTDISIFTKMLTPKKVDA